MSWIKEALTQLQMNGQCIIYPIGNSMRGRIESGQRVAMTNQRLEELRVGDVVFIRWKGNYLLHLILEIQANQLLIGNNVGKVNGWIDRKNVLAKAIQIGEE
jgi:hypothetical protein